MRPLDQILHQLQSRSDCAFRPATRPPKLPPGLQLPDDLAAFYARFSEAQLFGEPADPRYHILPPDEFTMIGLAVYGSDRSAPLQHSWRALAHVQDGNYIAIDCHPARLGYCYDAFHETAHDPGYCKIIALSFTELLNTAAANGDRAWWLHDDCPDYGYADKLRDSPSDP